MLASLLMFAAVQAEPWGVGNYWDGNRLYAECSATPASPTYYASVSYCTGFIVGISDMNTHVAVQRGAAPPFCVPQHVLVKQLRDVVLKYLQDSPGIRGNSAASLTVGALSEAFPCK